MFDFSQNYYALFDLDVSFDVDTKLLSERYKLVQQKVHPDRFAGGSDQDRRMAVQYTSFVNEAFNALKKPLSRARYLLALKEIEIDDNKTIADPDFLMEQMMLREQLEAVSLNKNQQTIEKALDDFFTLIQSKIANAQEDFLSAFNQEDLSAAENTFLKWQFLSKVQADAQAIEDGLL